MVQPFLDYLRYERRYSAHTVTAYQNDLATLGRFLFPEAAEGDATAELLTEATVQALSRQQLRSWLVSEPDLAKTTLRRRIASVRAFLKFAMRQGVIQTSPAARLVLPKLDRKLATFVPEADLTRVLESAPFPEGPDGILHRLVLELLYGCGLRRSEAIALVWADVRASQHLIRVFGKGRKERLVPYGAPVASLLDAMQAIWAEAGVAPEVILHVPGQPPLTAQRLYSIVKRYLGAVPGLAKSSPHVLRHSYATHLVNRGADLNAVKDLMGHSSLASTQVYVHNSVRRFKDLYKKSHPRAEES